MFDLTAGTIRPLQEDFFMGENPPDQAKNKGFWDGGATGHGNNKEASGRPSGLPGVRKPNRVGISTDVEFPAPHELPKE